jgi:hypothetical protein
MPKTGNNNNEIINFFMISAFIKDNKIIYEIFRVYEFRLNFNITGT